MSTLELIIKGNLTEEAKALADLEKLPDAPNPPQPPAVVNLSNGFYQIDKARILAVTSPEYRKFLRESGYGDLDSCSGIGFAKSFLRYDQSVRDAAARAGLFHTGNDGDYVVNINHPDARKLIEALGYKVPTVGLMYRLFIPYIKELAQSGNAEAQATLNEMKGIPVGKAEWLEDRILDYNRLLVGKTERAIFLPDKDGSFDRADINDFGYPTSVKRSGEFYRGQPGGNERAAIRNRGSEVDLNLSWGPSFKDDRLGVRPSKIFS